MICSNFKLLVIFFAVIIYGCSYPIDDAEYEKNGYDVDRFVPSSTEYNLRYVDRRIKYYTEHLDIYPITNGFDSIQYRLWVEDFDVCPNSYWSENLLIIKKYRTGQWKAILVKFGINDMKEDSNKVVCKNIENIEPRNWGYFIDSMNRLNVNSWRGNTFFSNDQYKGGYSTNFMFLEMATTTQYRLITHYAPRTTLCDQQECKEIRAFLNLISEEFKLPKFTYYVGNN